MSTNEPACNRPAEDSPKADRPEGGLPEENRPKRDTPKVKPTGGRLPASVAGARVTPGEPAPPELLVNVPRLISAYYTHRPDPDNTNQKVAFGTSGHRGSSVANSFNEAHILAICQAIVEHRQAHAITGPLYMGMDTHALSEPAFASAIEVFAVNGVVIRIQEQAGYTPTPVISHAILRHNAGRASGRSRIAGNSHGRRPS
jgi:alpha-D-glucose phosphate-specific phosphoglucomutase